MDGTFYARPHPFYQIFSIHAFVRSDNTVKQVPLFHVLMSHKSADDYVRVFKKVKEVLLGFVGDDDVPPAQLAVKAILSDFEKAIFKAARKVFVGRDFCKDLDEDESEVPTIEILGCAFHWAQAVFRKISTLGLGEEYRFVYILSSR